MEFVAIYLVPQNNSRPIVGEVVVEGHALHHARQRRTDGRQRLGPNIHA